MLISYPILGVTMKDNFADGALEKISGTYPFTPGQAWHGGVHINFPATAGNEVRAIADGTVIAFRAPTEKPNDASALDWHPLNYSGWTDDGFVLIKHEKESGENTKVTFFSLYMHLSELFKPLKGSAGAIQQGGNKDLWGDVHFVIPSGTTYTHDAPNAGLLHKVNYTLICV